MNLGDRHQDKQWDGDYDQLTQPVDTQQIVDDTVALFYSEWSEFETWWKQIGCEERARIEDEIRQIIDMAI